MPTSDTRIMSKQVASGNFNGFSFAFSNPSDGTISANNFRLNLALGGAQGFSSYVSDAGQELSADNRWAFVAVTLGNEALSDALDPLINFYIGGDRLANTVVSKGGSLFAGIANPGTLVANERDFRVGAQSEGVISAPIWIDDVRVYNQALSLGNLERVRLANVVPEPATVVLLILAAAGIRFWGRHIA